MPFWSAGFHASLPCCERNNPTKRVLAKDYIDWRFKLGRRRSSCIQPRPATKLAVAKTQVGA